MKSYLALLCCVLCLTACGGSSDKSENNQPMTELDKLSEELNKCTDEVHQEYKRRYGKLPPMMPNEKEMQQFQEIFEPKCRAIVDKQDELLSKEYPSQ
ncbi:MAG: hypothetical protein IKH45_01395 [Neisseriaceae bacterium]|nr:hypothetical protein [Neisseriaceae bacterium]MBO7554677.1 hypothetical protein [Neisseriaceae bacterium]MBQ5429232.1 hypothetical protein [Neisseriaceae bacterium]MBQ9683102.1 hypothetical protein [Neisseriaceae bacterium]MBR3481528.1 hypothetical protein [Neisseriaceae bacterium]